MPSKTKPLILVDGSSYLYRAFHAMPALTNSKSFPTGAVYGLINMLKSLLKEYQPEYLAVVFDAKGKTFRDDIYKGYKATRKEMPSELVQQIAPIHRIIREMGLPLVMIEGVEADDVIGTFATQAVQQDLPVLISTGDKDLAQLVNDKISLINTMTNTIYNAETVKDKFGVAPDRIIDYLTLVGDTSDNIPGVPQVGPKTAAKWIQQYGSLDALIEQADKISGKVGENFRTFLPQIPLTKSLVTIKLDVDIALDMSNLKLQPADKKALIASYKEMEFKNWLAELLEEIKENNVTTYAEYKLIDTEAALDAWLTQLSNAEFFAIELITDNTDYMRAKIIGIATAIAPGMAAYIPMQHDYPAAPKQLASAYVLSQLKPILENNALKKIGQNIKFTSEVLSNHKINLRGINFDTMMESYVLDSTSTTHDLDSLALKYLGWRTTTLNDIAGKGAKQIPFNHLDIQKVAVFAAEDVDITMQLHQNLWPRIQKESGLKSVLQEIEMPLIPVLCHVELNGVLIDPIKLERHGYELQERLIELEKEAYQLAGREFNINSPKQLQEILFTHLKLPVIQKTPTGQASTADPVLQELAVEFAMPKLIIEYRSLSKLMSTYTSRLIEQINPLTGRIHTSYNQTGTATGRLSSSEPNLQNIPIRTPEGRRIRQAFIAAKGNTLISADYSQIELRLMAHISQDPNLLKAFQQNLDIHKATAAEVWGVAIEDVTSEMRRNAKAINFGLIYGMSAFGLTRQLGIERKAAEEYIQRYFARYPQVKAYMDSRRAQARETGFVETLWGRRLYIPDIKASQIPRQKAGERVAINAPLQGSAADIIKLAMIQIDRWLTEEKIPAKMIMQVHDELVFEANADQAEAIAAGVRERMCNVIKLDAPLLVSVGIGANWDAASAH